MLVKIPCIMVAFKKESHKCILVLKNEGTQSFLLTCALANNTLSVKSAITIASCFSL